MVRQTGFLRTGSWKVKRENDNAIVCSLIKTPTIYLEPIPKQKIDYLMEEYPHQEWLAYLVGRVSKKENFFVEDLSIPPHSEVSGASAEAEPFNIPEGCIGIIHSHHSMGAFHSLTDKEYVDKNFLVSITVAKKGLNLEFDAISYQVTPCGKGTTTKCPIKYVLPPPLFEKDEFLTKAKDNIDKGSRSTVYAYDPDSGAYVLGARYPRHSRYGKRGKHGVPLYVPTHQPHLIPEKLPYSDYKDKVEYVIDGKGYVMSKGELSEHLKQIYGDENNEEEVAE